MVNLYEILGVPRDAEKEEIAAAIHELIRRWYCLSSHSNPVAAARAKKCLALIDVARATLLKPETRRLYDQALASPTTDGAGWGPPPDLPLASELYSEVIWVILELNDELAGMTKVCPGCGYRIDAKLAECAYCGYPKAAAPPPAPPIPDVLPLHQTPLPTCGPLTGALGPAPRVPAPVPPRRAPVPPRPAFARRPTADDRPTQPLPASTDVPTQPPPGADGPSGFQFLPASEPLVGQPPLTSPSGGHIPSFASQPLAQPAPLLPQRRFGRIEYISPLDKDREYPLRVGLLLERHGRQALDQARVQWVSLRIPAAEREPLLRVVPISTHLRITPAFRDVRLKQGADVFADFRLLAEHLPSTPNNEIALQIDFEYNGERIFSKSVPLRIQDQHRLGPIRIPHSYWRLFGAAGGLAVALDTGSSLMQSAGLGDVSLLVQIVVLLLSLGMIGFSLYLWRRAGRRVRI